LVQQGTFRADLYYRLSVFTVNLPPLRSRKDDIAVLSSHFIKKHAPEGPDHLRLTSAAVAALIDYDWPGNVRELENAIIRGIHRAKSDEWIDVQDLGLPISKDRQPESVCEPVSSTQKFQTLKQQAILLFERKYLMNLMIECQGNVTRAAHTAGKERRALGRLLQKYQIDPKRFMFPAP
jgi:DNA-binding NtrC family response regulator